MKKVWNITDHPKSKVPASVLMLFGKRVLPGRYVKVEDSQLKNAHKIQKDAAAGLVFVGDKPPADYAAKKTPARARLPKDHVRPQVAKVAKKAAAPKVKITTEAKPAGPKEESSGGKAKKTGK